jgi:hypothetical protein
MKKQLIILIILGAFVFPMMAQTDSVQQTSKQDDGEIKTLFNKSKHPMKIGWYVGPEAGYTRFGDKNVYLAGISFGAIIDHNFSIGLGANAIANSGNLWYNNVNDTSGAYLYGGYGGLKLEFKLFPSYPVHINFPILIGGGGLAYNTWIYHCEDKDQNDYDGNTLDWDGFFVVEPGIMVEINLLKYMRLDAGVSYRYTPDLQLMNTSSGLINNFNANLSLKFGMF